MSRSPQLAPTAPRPEDRHGAISVRGLRKSFGDHLVLDGIDLEVAPGTIHALLGPNGSGKTTTVQILSTLIRSDGGEVRVGGHDVDSDPEAIRGLIGVTGQFSAVDGLLTGAENLRLMADLGHRPRAEGRARAASLLEQFELTDAADQLPVTYSGGMRRRLDLAMTLMGSPRIIFLDEPTAGLDPRSRRGLWAIVRDLVAEGVTILLTTQYLEEADQLADRISVLDHGRIIAAGTPAELKRLAPGGHLRLELADERALGAAADAYPAALVDPDALTVQVPSDGSVKSLRDTLESLDRQGIEVSGLSIHLPDLDDVFLALTGKDASAEGSANSLEEAHS